jgi:hypothetical protein
MHLFHLFFCLPRDQPDNSGRFAEPYSGDALERLYIYLSLFYITKTVFLQSEKVRKVDEKSIEVRVACKKSPKGYRGEPKHQT